LGAKVLFGLLLLILVHKPRLLALSTNAAKPASANHPRLTAKPVAAEKLPAAVTIGLARAVAAVGLKQLPHPLVLAQGGRGSLVGCWLGLSVQFMLGVCIRTRSDWPAASGWCKKSVGGGICARPDNRGKSVYSKAAGRSAAARRRGGRRIDPARRASGGQAGLGRPERPRPLVSLWGLKRVEGVLPRQLATECADRPRPRKLRALGRHEEEDRAVEGVGLIGRGRVQLRHEAQRLARRSACQLPLRGQVDRVEPRRRATQLGGQLVVQQQRRLAHRRGEPQQHLRLLLLVAGRFVVVAAHGPRAISGNGLFWEFYF
jgi:hypothetical protein